MDFALVATSHYKNLEIAMATTKPLYDGTKAYMEDLYTKGGKGKFTEITKTDSICIDYDEWPEWCEAHADEVMGGHPDSEAGNIFKESMIKSFLQLKLSKAAMKEGQLLELGYEDGDSQFIFGYCAICANKKQEGEMHVLVSGFGKKWESAPGHALDKPWWEENAGNVKGFVKYGAQAQARDLLEGYAAVEEPAVEEPAVEEPAVEELAVEEPAATEPAQANAETRSGWWVFQWAAGVFRLPISHLSPPKFR